MRFTGNIARLAAAVALGLALSACGGGDGGDDAAATGSQDASTDAELTQQVTGSVGDGPVVDATIEVSTNQGELLQRAVSSQLAGYDLKIKTKGKYYPLLIEATGGTDLVTNAAPDFKLAAVALTPGRNEVVNLSPFSTLAVAAARETPGGLNATNVASAMSTVLGEFNSGLSTLASNPMSTKIDGSNLAEIVRASEVLAETFRRTNDTIVAGGGSSTVDDVIAKLGADLADGQLDGAGSANVDPHVSAVAAVAAAQVLVEVMTNQLRVHGQAAAAALDAAVDTLLNKDGPSTASVPVTAAMIDRAKIGVASASAIAPSAALSSLLAGLETLQANVLPEAAASALPADSSAAFDPALTDLAPSTSADVETVNAILAGGTSTTPPPPPANAPPVISGTPPASVLQGSPYKFVPNASDPDGDTLVFSVANLPRWATFDSASGTMAGTPSAADLGTYSDIAISVSDGSASAQLAPFSVTVQAAASGSATLTWTAPTQRTDGSPLLDLAGFRIYWGTSSDSLGNKIPVDNPGLTTYVVENLASGYTYYFATTAVDSKGVESSMSNVASKSIP
ncbi:MAG TPA: putative Ig domain-containing protein [Gammaproteobacteria bacterium]|nr:putative Ig domain-containing protein [Gammaproteobacteria bacterium]